MADYRFALEGKRIFVAGHRGMVGQAIVRALRARGLEPLVATRAECDLTRQAEVEAWLETKQPEVVVVAAAKVGGIMANATYPVDFLELNLQIQTNLIGTSHRIGVQKLLFLGSSCIYPKLCPQPIKEEYLLTGPLEPTNSWYAIAKIAGLELCRAYRQQHGADFISTMPCNLYGPGDNFDLETSHVLPALIRKMHEAKVRGDGSVGLWGTGSPRREFLHVDDLAAACLFLLERYSEPAHINVGCGEDQTIRELAEMIQDVVGFRGELAFDTSKPDGTPRKVLDTSRINALGWRPKVRLRDGIESAYREFLSTIAK